MYKVYCDNTLICDSRVEDLALSNPVIKLEENKAGSFSFSIPPEHPYYDVIERRKSVIEVYEDDELTFSGECIKVDVDFYKQKKISCEGEFAYFNDSIQRPARYQGVTVRGLLEAYVANHNAQVDERKRFEVGIVTVTDPNDYLYCYTNMESTMKCFKEDLVDNLGGFFRVRHENGVRYLDYLAESPNTCSQIIKLGKNLIDFKSNIDSTEIATAIIPLGAKLETSAVEGLETRLTIESVNDGKDYVFSQDAVDAFGWIQKVVEFDNVTTAENLKTKGEKYLADIQFENIVIEAKAIDLHSANGDIERFKLSDQIRVLSAAHGMDRYFRLTKETRYLNDPAKNPITLGKNERLTLTARNNQANADIKKAIDAISPNSIVKEAVANATQIIQNAMNGYVTTVLNEDGTAKELLIMDTPSTETATKVWRWNINGLGYSSTGYNGEYALAMTMDGSIVADRITTGTLNSVNINNGDGKFTVDENGKVVATTGTIAGWNIAPNMLSKTIDLYPDMTEEGLKDVADNDPVQYIVWIQKPASATTASFYIGYRPKSYYLSGGLNWYTSFVARPNGEVMANKFKSSNAEITGGSIKIQGVQEGTNVIQLHGTLGRSIDIDPYGVRLENRESMKYAQIINGAFFCGELLDESSFNMNASITSSGMITSQYAYDTVVSNAPNVYLDGGAAFKRSSSSSKRYKTDITEAINEELNPQKLYEVPVKMFKYKEGYLSEGDSKIGKNIIGFIVEDLEEKYASAVQYNAEGEAEMWNSNIMIPAMLKLIQEQNQRILTLEERLGVTNG